MLLSWHAVRIYCIHLAWFLSCVTDTLSWLPGLPDAHMYLGTYLGSKATAGQQQLGYDVSPVGQCLLLVAVSEAVEAQDPASTWAVPTSFPFGLKHLHFSQILG